MYTCFATAVCYWRCSSSSSSSSRQWLPHRTICLHVSLSHASSTVTPTSSMSSFTTSANLLWGLPLSLSTIILCPMYPVSPLSTCPHRLHLALIHGSAHCYVPNVPLICSFLVGDLVLASFMQPSPHKPGSESLLGGHLTSFGFKFVTFSLVVIYVEEHEFCSDNQKLNTYVP